VLLKIASPLSAGIISVKMGIEKQIETWYAMNELLWDIGREKDLDAKTSMKKIYMEMLNFYEDTYKVKFLPNQRPIETFK